ncbi:cyclopropane-fatty-acyl-phospholipid synthase [Crenobacter luteus]|uniref:Cyclopropane-fatty-acyl-phospholipid synthase n=1 Tax=Crenobacter luteus TaxID=1452487 RepID=A0A165F5L3_9NEIS|nr:cyclopropane-fatty-acyl-phospholipid synthase family protein [Crenobacter luteus]KZE31481.1 cyclopropane-fatty-acyl-phospholipid synthase [Crenobacter luteus]TCP11809.1 cyclopropane-fatty-acyl-phospholipid synthase [Crenobacter luteus]
MSSDSSPRSPAIVAPLPPAAARALFATLARIETGELLVCTPDGARHRFCGHRPGRRAELTIRDWRAVGRIMLSGDIGLAEAYRDGQVDSPHWSTLMALALANEAAFSRPIHGRLLGTLAYWLRHLRRANTRRGSRRNIHAHYDLGNAFYRLWLDSTMSYSSALFDGQPQRSLASAQEAKYERILARLDPKPGATLLEIGCGWGGFAEYAIRTRGVQLTGITLSTEQLDYARARLARAGLAGSARFELADYRDVGGRYDHVVSIEMIEAVGERWWPTYFAVLRERLAPGGRAMVQGITIADEHFPRYRRGTDFIQQYIFPGGMLPSPSALARAIAAAGLELADRFAFGHDYAETLRRWARAFEAALPRVRSLGFDEDFVRLWRFYLAYCEAGFTAGRTDVWQLEIRRP